MKVLHVTSGLLFGGVETFQLALVAAAREHTPGTVHGFAVFFDGRFWQELQARSIPATLLGAASLSKPWTVARAALKLRRAVAEQVADVVVLHSTWTQALFLPVLRTLKVPVVLYVHSARTQGWPDRLGPMLRADGVVAVSHAVRKSWQGVIDRWACPHTVIYCPLQLPPAKPRVERRGAVRILMAARMEGWKGHGKLLEALALLRDEPGWLAQLAGGPQAASEQVYFDALKAQAQTLGIAERVEFLGQRSDVPALLAAADIYCQPNLDAEGLGLSFVEAMATGLPVITSRLGPAEEVVGQAGVLLPAGDAYAVAQALRKLIKSPEARAHYHALGPVQARKISDPAARVRDTENFLQQVKARA